MALATDLKQLGLTTSQVEFLGNTQANDLSANGTTQGAGTAITSTISRFTDVTAGVKDASTLPLIKNIKSFPYVVRNDSAATLNVFPASGESINSLAANASIGVTTSSALLFYPISSTAWVTK